MAGMGNEFLKQMLGLLLILISVYSLSGDLFKQLFFHRKDEGQVVVGHLKEDEPEEEFAQAEEEGGVQKGSRAWDRFLQVLTGCVSGVTGGMFGMPGPPIVVYCIEKIHDKQAYVASLQAVFFTSNVFYTLFRFQAGFSSSHTFYYWLAGVVGVLIGVAIGAHLFEKISGQRLRVIVYCFMLISGFVTIF